MPDQPGAPVASCAACGKAWLKSDHAIRPAALGRWICTDQDACAERQLRFPIITDSRDNPVPVIAARAALEALLWPVAGMAYVDRILDAADCYASAATADHAGLDAILGPRRLAEAAAEAQRKERKDDDARQG